MHLRHVTLIMSLFYSLPYVDQSMLFIVFVTLQCVYFFPLNRQKSLEDSLLVAGQFKDALQLLLDWLYKVEPSLNEDQPVHGDVDTVNNLIEQHRVHLFVVVSLFTDMLFTDILLVIDGLFSFSYLSVTPQYITKKLSIHADYVSQCG